MSEENEYDLPKGKKLKIDVEVNSREMENMITRLNKAESELETVTTEKEDAESKLRIIAERLLEDKKKRLNAPDSIKTIDELREWQEENHPDPVGLGGSGNLSLEGNLKASGKLKEGFDSIEDLIDDLHRTKNKPVLDKLWKKNLDAIKSGDLPNIILDENDPKFKDKPSIIMKAIERQNEQLRKKMLERKGEK